MDVCVSHAPHVGLWAAAAVGGFTGVVVLVVVVVMLCGDVCEVSEAWPVIVQ